MFKLRALSSANQNHGKSLINHKEFKIINLALSNQKLKTFKTSPKFYTTTQNAFSTPSNTLTTVTLFQNILKPITIPVKLCVEMDLVCPDSEKIKGLHAYVNVRQENMNNKDEIILSLPMNIKEQTNMTIQNLKFYALDVNNKKVIDDKSNSTNATSTETEHISIIGPAILFAIILLVIMIINDC